MTTRLLTCSGPISGAVRAGRWRRAVVAVGLMAVLGGCSSISVPDYLDPFDLFEDQPAPAETAGAQATRERAEETAAAAGDQAYPTVASVPERPPAPAAELRDRVVDGLVADRRNARYTADAVEQEAAQRLAPDAATGSPALAEARPRPAERPVVRPAAGPEEDPAATVTAPAPPALQQAAAPQTPARGATVAPPPVPAAPGRATAVPARIADEGAAPPKPQAVERASVDDDKARSIQQGRDGQPAPVATIQFSTNSTKLDSRDRDILRQIANVHRQSGGLVRVVGHASGINPKSSAEVQANKRVSMQRAQVVAQELIALGVDPAMVAVEGMAADDPIYDESRPTGEAGNRRAEIYLVL